MKHISFLTFLKKQFTAIVEDDLDRKIAGFLRFWKLKYGTIVTETFKF